MGRKTDDLQRKTERVVRSLHEGLKSKAIIGLLFPVSLVQDSQKPESFKEDDALLGPIPMVKIIPFSGTVAAAEKVAVYCILKAGFAHDASHRTRTAEVRLEIVPVPVLDRH